MSVGVMEDYKLRYLRPAHTLGSSIPVVILRDVSFTEVDNVCRVAIREPIHLCTCVREEGVMLRKMNS